MMVFLAQIPPALVAAVGAALVHFLWQGVLVGFGLALALRLSRQASSELRYGLCVGAAVLLLLLPVATAIQSYVAPPKVASEEGWMPGGGITGAFSEPVNAESAGEPAGPSPEQPPARLDRRDILRFIALQLPYLALRLWLYALPLFLLRLALGLYGVGRLRRLSVPVEDPAWLQRFDALKTRVGTTARVRWATSEAVSQPALLGWIRPMVVVPASLFAGVPIAHVEALLVHELTHIRRHDALVMYLQALLETLFFYHPAVWWVSRRLRIEREYACDAAAVEVLGDDLTYVRALAGLEERRGPALALGASDGRLVDRIRRIVSRTHTPRPPARTPSWALATVLVLAGGLLVAACGRNSGEPIQGSPDELFLQAVEQVKQGDFFRAQEIAEQSAEAGNLCSMQLLAELLTGDPFPQVGRPEAFRLGLPWLGQDTVAGKIWADRLVTELSERAEAGDGDAMLWLAVRYSSNWFIPGMWMGGKNDSLSRYWNDRALAAGHPIARRGHARKLAQEGRSDEADALFEELGRQGDAYAFWQWSWYYLDPRNNRVDPEKYFTIASIAIESEAEGLHDWLGSNLRALQEQYAQGNPEAQAYMAIVNRLDLINRLAALPEAPWDPGRYIMPPLCEAQEKLYELYRRD